LSRGLSPDEDFRKLKPDKVGGAIATLVKAALLNRKGFMRSTGTPSYSFHLEGALGA